MSKHWYYDSFDNKFVKLIYNLISVNANTYFTLCNILVERFVFLLGLLSVQILKYDWYPGATRGTIAMTTTKVLPSL